MPSPQLRVIRILVFGIVRMEITVAIENRRHVVGCSTHKVHNKIVVRIGEHHSSTLAHYA